MPKLPPDPLAGTDRLLIDGANLLHALRRGPDAPPPTTLIGRLRGTVPAEVGIELVLDGPPDRGMHNTRVASGLIVRHSGRRTADQVILTLVEEAAQALSASRAERQAGLDNVLVVTDDRELRTALHARGVRSAGTRWLIGRLERRRVESPGVGNVRAPRAPAARPPAGRAPVAGSAADGEEAERRGWRPGRGATAKKGNPRRGHRPPA